MKRYRCQAHCPGFIDHSVNLLIDLPRKGETMFHPCDTCGMLHWESSSFAFYDRTAKSFVYYISGKLVDCLDCEIPVNFKAEMKEGKLESE